MVIARGCFAIADVPPLAKEWFCIQKRIKDIVQKLSATCGLIRDMDSYRVTCSERQFDRILNV